MYIWNLACPSNVPCRLKLIFIASKLNCNPDHVSINILLQIEWISFQHWHIFWQIFQIKQPVWSLIVSCLMDQFWIFENIKLKKKYFKLMRLLFIQPQYFQVIDIEYKMEDCFHELEGFTQGHKLRMGTLIIFLINNFSDMHSGPQNPTRK